jgi:hypothetical protein
MSIFNVYLDHHIERIHLNREELLRHQSVPSNQDLPEYLSIQDLYGSDSWLSSLKKPDQQRLTCLWTPEECVQLLEAVFNEQALPSIVLWRGPDGSRYVVDGGHRISTLIAWVKDDWGDRLPSGAYKDKAQESVSKVAANRVRTLLKERGVGTFNDYQSAAARYEELKRELGHEEPVSVEMDADSLRYAEMVRKWKVAKIGLHILWVKGNYAHLETSVASYLEAYAQLRIRLNDAFETPEFQSAHRKLLEKLTGEPETNGDDDWPGRL